MPEDVSGTCGTSPFCGVRHTDWEAFIHGYSRRQFIEGVAAAAGFAASPVFALEEDSKAASDKPVVYWTPEISSASLRRMYNLIKGGITGKVALKLFRKSYSKLIEVFSDFFPHFTRVRAAFSKVGCIQLKPFEGQ